MKGLLSRLYVKVQEYRKAQTMTEYALILAAVAIVVFITYEKLRHKFPLADLKAKTAAAVSPLTGAATTAQAGMTKGLSLHARGQNKRRRLLWVTYSYTINAVERVARRDEVLRGLFADDLLKPLAKRFVADLVRSDQSRGRVAGL
jgi:hypothetical protein